MQLRTDPVASALGPHKAIVFHQESSKQPLSPQQKEKKNSKKTKKNGAILGRNKHVHFLVLLHRNHCLHAQNMILAAGEQKNKKHKVVGYPFGDGKALRGNGYTHSPGGPAGWDPLTYDLCGGDLSL